MDNKKRRNISISDETDERLRRDKHASATIETALKVYWEGRDGAKVLAKLIQDNSDSNKEVSETLQDLSAQLNKVVNFMRSQGANI